MVSKRKISNESLNSPFYSIALGMGEFTKERSVFCEVPLRLKAVANLAYPIQLQTEIIAINVMCGTQHNIDEVDRFWRVKVVSSSAET